MKFHLIFVPLVAAVCLVLRTGDAGRFNLNQLSRKVRATRVPLLINVPDNPSGAFKQQLRETSPESFQTTNNRGVTVVEIVRSVEVKLNGSNELNAETTSMVTDDLLFSDIDNENNVKQISRQSAERHKDNSRAKYRRIKEGAILPVTSIETNDENEENDWKSTPKGIFRKNLPYEGLDFNSRILLGNVLVRKCNNEIGDHKYIYFSDPNVSDNKHHVTYINHNSSTAFNTSRINVKFPPKMLPFKNINAQQNRPNKTSITSNKISQSQKALYRSRIGKQSSINLKNIKHTENENKQNLPESIPTNIPQTQDRKERLQALTHWDFGKKTPNSPTDENSYVPTSSISKKPSMNQISSDLVTDLPHTAQPSRYTLQPIEVTTRRPVTENEIEQPVEPQVILQNAFPKHQKFRIYSNINNIQTLPVAPTVNIESAQPDHGIHTHNGNVIRQYLGSHMFSNSHYSGDLVSENVEDLNARAHSSQTATAQNYIPVANIVQQSEQQHDVQNNLRPVIFVPHVALQQQRHFPAVVTLQAVDAGGVTRGIPVVAQHQNSPHLYQAALVDPNSALPVQNAVVYEGVLVPYPRDKPIQGEYSEIVPVYFA
ncbi:uncharacterized protein LOC110831061 [Zootermopsis nevadensis]|nr:uncharacterized protein LOC110831061 [Zootermopsis nevadensis]